MVQFLSVNFFSWISSIFVGFFKSSRFFVSLYYLDEISCKELKLCCVKRSCRVKHSVERRIAIVTLADIRIAFRLATECEKLISSLSV